MIILYILAGLAATLGLLLGIFLIARSRRQRSRSPASPPPLTDEQLDQVERVLWSEKLMQRVSKRGLRGRPIL